MTFKWLLQPRAWNLVNCNGALVSLFGLFFSKKPFFSSSKRRWHLALHMTFWPCCRHYCYKSSSARWSQQQVAAFFRALLKTQQQGCCWPRRVNGETAAIESSSYKFFCSKKKWAIKIQLINITTKHIGKNPHTNSIPISTTPNSYFQAVNN